MEVPRRLVKKSHCRDRPELTPGLIIAYLIPLDVSLLEVRAKYCICTVHVALQSDFLWPQILPLLRTAGGIKGIYVSPGLLEMSCGDQGPEGCWS